MLLIINKIFGNGKRRLSCENINNEKIMKQIIFFKYYEIIIFNKN